MQDLVYFVGRFHVLALHLPIGIIVVAVALDWIARREKYARFRAASPFLWGATALAAVLTVVLGYMHFAEGAFTGPSAKAHRLFGTCLAIATIGIWWLSRRPGLYRRVNVATGILALGLVSVTGHFGGDLTHGSTFLWQYAPGPLRAMAGAANRPIVTSVAQADVYYDVVQPLLERRCGGCHNDDKRENGFSVGSYESTLRGGDTGSAIDPGKADSSELYRRISLPHDDDEFMPAEGKTPLTDEQVSIIKWWIDAGAPRDKTAGEVSPDENMQQLLASQLGLSSTGQGASGPESVAVADPAVIDQLYRAGFLVRQVSQTDAHLVVSIYSPGTAIDSEGVAALLKAAGQIVELNLQDAELDDEDFVALGTLTELRRLRLSHNNITDKSVVSLARLTQLERLNLYANAGVTDASVDTFASLKSLRRLDVWQTGITSEGIQRLSRARPDIDVQFGEADVLGKVEAQAPAAPRPPQR